MTSASRSADWPVWELLQHARDRKASLGVVLSRIPQAYRTELVDHFNAMLDANGIAAADRFVSEGMPRGIALLDTPDIDSVVQAHHEFALQFLDASDLWLFMTSASRYADGPVWEILQHARDRKASLGVVLSRIPQAYRTELVDHFNAMLDANGIAAADRFVIQETPLIDGMLPADAYQPVRDWLADTAARSTSRSATGSRTPPPGPTAGSRCCPGPCPVYSTRSSPGSRLSPRTSRRRWCCAHSSGGRPRRRMRMPSPRPAPA